MNKFLILGGLIAIILTVGLAYTSAQVNIGEDPTDVYGVVIPLPDVLALGGNLTNFTSLEDTPNTYVSEAGKCVVVNAGETDLEFVVCASGAGINIFDQDLNTTSNVTFDTVNVTGALAIGDDGDLTHELDVHGHSEFEHTATEDGDHTIEIDTDVGTFGDVKALFIDYDTGAIVDGQDEEIIFINLDQFAALGGEISGLQIVSTEGGGNVTGLEVGVQVHPILQLSGIFADMDSALNNTNDVLTQFTTDGDDIPIFAFDDDTVTIGNLVRFEEIEWILDTEAGGGGIKPVFYFSTGVGTWGEFTPADGTSGLRDSGIMIWEDSDIPTWTPGLDMEFLIRINRTQNNIPVVPVERLVQIASATEFFWNRDGEILVSAVNTTGNLTTGDTLKNSGASGGGTFIQILTTSMKIIAGGSQMFLFDASGIQNIIQLSLLGLDNDLEYDGVTVENLFRCDAGNEDCTFKDLNIENGSVSELFSFERTDQTISSGAISATSSYMRLDTEGAASTDDLFNITGGSIGSMLILQSNNNGRDIIVVDASSNTNAGNIELSSNYTLINNRRRLTLLFDGADWVELTESNN